jgi:hypothetical protein
MEGLTDEKEDLTYTYDLTTTPNMKDIGWMLFDHKKNTVVAGCFVDRFHFLLLLLLLVTFGNYFLLLKVHCLLLFY